MFLSESPSDSRVLIVGAGTGAELINLANYFPLWNFTVVEPASAMLDVCRQRAEKMACLHAVPFMRVALNRYQMQVVLI